MLKKKKTAKPKIGSAANRDVGVQVQASEAGNAGDGRLSSDDADDRRPHDPDEDDGRPHS